VSGDTPAVDISVVDTPVVDTPVVDTSVVDTSTRSLSSTVVVEGFSSTVVVEGFDVDDSTASVLLAVVDRTVVVTPPSSEVSSK